MPSKANKAAAEAPAAVAAGGKVAELKDEGNKLFAKRDYAKAAQLYQQGLESATTAERVDLLCNRAACFYQMKQ